MQAHLVILVEEKLVILGIAIDVLVRRDAYELSKKRYIYPFQKVPTQKTDV